ncbi:MAG: hypothetical protein DRI30_03660, partial [Chloroflexi bacterium]
MRLHDYLDYQAREHPDNDFAILDDRHVTYAEALAEVNRVANALVGAGLQTGDRIAVLSKNSIEYIFMFYGASKAGVVIVPLNYRMAGPEWEYMINDAGARMILASAGYVGSINGIKASLGAVSAYIAIDGGADGWQDYQAWQKDQPETPPAREITDEHEVYQMYTSGTTGRPKGAVLTHGAVTANMEQLTLEISALPGERDLIVAPVYHAAAAITCFSAVVWG